MTWVLIIVIAYSTGGPNSVTTQEFFGEPACKQAGEAAAKLHPGLRWACVKKGS